MQIVPVAVREGFGIANNGKVKEEGDVAGASGFCLRHRAGAPECCYDVRGAMGRGKVQVLE